MAIDAPNPFTTRNVYVHSRQQPQPHLEWLVKSDATTCQRATKDVTSLRRALRLTHSLACGFHAGNCCQDNCCCRIFVFFLKPSHFFRSQIYSFSSCDLFCVCMYFEFFSTLAHTSQYISCTCMVFICTVHVHVFCR